MAVTQLKTHLRKAWRRIFPRRLDRWEKPIESGGLRAVCHHEWPDDAALVAGWEKLLAEVSSATGFHSPTWVRAVYETQGKPGHLRLLVVWRGPELVAVLPMHLRQDGLLESLDPGVSDYCDPVVHPEHEPAALALLLKLIVELRSGNHRNVTLHNLRDDSSTRRLLPELARLENFAVDEKVVEHCPAVALPGSWDDYLATLDAHERKETRRKVNKAMTKAAARVVRCPPNAADVAAALPVALSLMEQAPGEKGEAVREHLRPLLERVGPAMIAEGRLWLDTLYLNDRPAACTLQFPHASGPQLYNCGFDAGQREFSPGVVLTAEILRQAIESGAGTFDLLRGREAYKYKLGAVDRPLWMITLRRV
jgi:CelD/BcsL family acetyltransferase involved in cellulose biosynthesis